MDKLRNPFSPGAGTPPPELAGRSAVIDKVLLTLARVKLGRSEKSLMIVGLRGVGKTVLLNRAAQDAEAQGYRVIFIEADEKKSLPELIVPHLRRVLLGLDQGERISEYAKRGLRSLKSFVNGAKLKYGDLEISLDYDPEIGIADSGDLSVDIADLLQVLGEAARDRGTAIAIIIDEIQYLTEDEFSALIMAAHRLAQKALPVVIIGAGLPQLVAKAGSAKSYAERLFDYPEVGKLPNEDAKKALRDPIINEGASITEGALEKIIATTQGYPYFLQEWGYQSWNNAKDHISEDVIDEVDRLATERLDQNFFRVRFDRLTPREKDYLRAMASLGDDAHRSGDIAGVLREDVKRLAPIRSSLISKGMVYSPAHGDTAFTVPLFGGFMRRIMPDWGKDI